MSKLLQSLRSVLAGRLWDNTPGTRSMFFARVTAASLCTFLMCTFLLAQESPKEPAKKETKKGSAEKGEESDKPIFLRVHREKKKLKSLQTNIVTYEAKDGEYQGAKVALVGAVHIAEPEYYAELNRRFATYEAVLFELVADPETRLPEKGEAANTGHPIGAMQVGMKEMLDLEFQLDGIDYKQPNFVHADMTPTEMAASMKERGDGLMTMLFRSMGAGLAQQATGDDSGSDLAVLGAFFSSNRELAMKRAMAKNFESMEKQMAAIAGKDGKSTLITERNVKAFEVLKKQLDAGRKNVAVFYGAGHLPDMHNKLIADFKMQPIKTEWLDAWDLTE